MAKNWRPASGYSAHKTRLSLWRVCRDRTEAEKQDSRGTFDTFLRRDNRAWLAPQYETAKRKAEELNTLDFEQVRPC